MNSGQNIPKFEVQFNQLPSRGLGYKEGVKVYYRGYTVGELSKVASVRQDNITMDFLLKSALDGITVEGMDKLDLSYIDVLALGLRRRVSSEGELKFKMGYRCEKCKDRQVLIFDHTDIKFSQIPEKFKIEDEEFDVKLPVKLMIKEVECEFGYPTVRNMLDANNKKLEDKGLVLSAMTIRNLEFQVAYDLITNLTEFEHSEDMENMKLVTKSLYHDITDIPAVCKNEVLNKETDQKVVCGHTNHISVEGKELLLKPFRESQAPARNKIRFGN